ncbi:TetR/AcrR family transcriptional regulator [Pimelobacter simplex]|uniref:TetR/AcrR family transcriptional regulator n=1 Tax=Nocardioides simplex TaxID=2045 RepID=UPI0021506AC8|nr:TetR/AcrR family transcriptional regulator [Pimelobacter simplex]UUW87948.1 TetR/AcrR family transcriptional regulator [Pimelobacter simplex]UUW97453.1 TetR/AcrR family transcriptional regulator [Pimelobacter simplex]
MEIVPAPRPSLREQQKRQTRATILDAAAGLIGAQGFRETTIDDIAKAAGASRATLYSYFPSKDLIVREIVIELWNEAETLYRVFGNLEEWTRESIGGWVEHLVDAWEASAVRLRVQNSGLVRYDDFYVDYHRRFVTALTANAALWARFDEDDVPRRALVLIGGLATFMNTWLVRGWETDRPGAVATLTDVWCAILRVP